MAVDSGGRVLLSNSASWNRYSYTGGDPINRTDPMGTDWVCVGPSDDCTWLWYDPSGIGEGQGIGGSGRVRIYSEVNAEQHGSPGQRSRFIHVGNPSKTGANERPIDTILDWIRNNIDADCAARLNGVGGAIADLEGDPSNLDTVLIGHGTMDIGSAAFTGNNPENTDAPPGYAMTVNDAGAFFNATAKNPVGQTVTLSVNGYTGDTSQAQVAILLHELAHFLNADGFKNDLQSDAKGRSNEALVKKHCKNTLNAAKNIP